MFVALAVDASPPPDDTLSSTSGNSRCRPVSSAAGAVAGSDAAVASSITVPLAVTSAADVAVCSLWAAVSAVASEYLLASLRSLSASDRELALSRSKRDRLLIEVGRCSVKSAVDMGELTDAVLAAGDVDGALVTLLLLLLGSVVLVVERSRCNLSGLVCGLDAFALNVASRSAALVCTDDTDGTLIVADMLVLMGDVGDTAGGVDALWLPESRSGEVADSLRPNGVGGWPVVGEGIVKVAVTILLSSSSSSSASCWWLVVGLVAVVVVVAVLVAVLSSQWVAMKSTMVAAAAAADAVDAVRLVGVGGALIVYEAVI